MCRPFEVEVKPPLSTVNPKRKLVNYRDYGMPENQNDDKIRLLAGHILEVISYIDQKEWDKAGKALLDDESARLCGLRIDSPFGVFRNIDDAVRFTRRKAMWFRTSKKLRLPQVAIVGNELDSDHWKYPTDVPSLANAIFPIWLEEWIHAFQFLISSPVCDESVLFQQSPQFKNSWSINEVDIFVIYRGLDWDNDMLREMKNIYSERVAFADFSCKS